MSNVERKRKRLQNTTQEQYEMYLSFMENDYIFKSNTINPTVEPDYLINKWKDLTIKLNSIGKGPALSTEEWKKRFTDWKYATKNKFRKIMEHSKKTGSGPKLNLEMTHVEERGLSVWGRVSVTGANVTEYEGIGIIAQPEQPEVDVVEIQPQQREIEVVVQSQSNIGNEIVYELHNKSLQEENVMLIELQQPTTSFQPTETLETPMNAQRKQRDGRRRPKPLSLLAEKLIKCSESSTIANSELNNTLKTFFDKYIEFEKEKIALEREKLTLEREKFKFEISKIKFSNKDFDF